MTIEQFLADPSFHSWALQQNENDVVFWENWRARHPELAGRMDEARMLIAGLEFTKHQTHEHDKTAAWDALQTRLNLPAVQPRYRRQIWWAMAAGLALLFCAGWWLFLHPTDAALETVRTTFAEIRTLKLPDGSTVTLNANSELQYPKNWGPGQIRAVRLNGEAFFEVRPGRKHERFRVQLEPGEVDVLGTRFNVNTRRQAPVVSLVEGKTRVRLASTGLEKTMNPGETAYMDPAGAIRILAGETAMQTSWKEHKWIFDNSPLAQVLQRIEDEFGLKTAAVTPELLKKRVSGQVSTRKKAVLFKALEVLLEVEISESPGEISISKKE